MNNTKFLRVMRLDESDLQVYDTVAEPGEWALPGTFYFWDLNPATVDSKTKQAFSHGFLGIGSFGWSTLVTVAEIGAAELDVVTRRLAMHLVECFGAPDVETALPAAREEVAFAASLCDHAVDTLIALRRDFDDDRITESFSVVQPPSGTDHSLVKLFGVENYHDAKR